MDAWISAAAAVLVGLLSFFGTYLSNRKSQGIIEYRIKLLEKKQDKHNNLIERTYKLEEKMNGVENEVRDIKSRLH